MRFERDEAKNKENIRKHGIDFADAQEGFQGPLLVEVDTRQEYGEDRWIGIGSLQKRKLVVVIVFTEREPEAIRVISLRKAKKHEKERSEEAVRDRLETS